MVGLFQKFLGLLVRLDKLIHYHPDSCINDPNPLILMCPCDIEEQNPILPSAFPMSSFPLLGNSFFTGPRSRSNDVLWGLYCYRFFIFWGKPKPGAYFRRRLKSTAIPTGKQKGSCVMNTAATTGGRTISVAWLYVKSPRPHALSSGKSTLKPPWLHLAPCYNIFNWVSMSHSTLLSPSQGSRTQRILST